jgi:hypothetical protein
MSESKIRNSAFRRSAMAAAFGAAGLGAAFGGLVAIEPEQAAALAADMRCDFSNDGIPDSVTGIPGRTVDGKLGAGAIMVRYQFAALEFPVMYESVGLTPATGNHYGAALACGDFDGDGDSDLAIGAPGHDSDAGAVVILYSDGVELTERAAFTQDTSKGGFNVPGAKEPGDLFGWALAAGDFNNDGEDDLAIGAPGEDVTISGKTYTDFGSMVVLNGSGASGLTANGVMFDSTDANSQWMLKDHRAMYGYSLAVGDFDADAIEDLAVGIPGASVQDFHSKDKFYHVGAVHELRGNHHAGLSNQQFFWESLYLPNNGPRNGDSFGFALAAGDIDDNGRDDLAIGAPGDWANLSFPDPCEGDVCESDIHSSPGKLFIVKHTQDQFGNESYIYTSYRQGDPGVPGEAEQEDAFGFSVAVGQFDGRYGEDIAVGAPGENDGMGAVVVFYSGGVRELLWQGTPVLPTVPQAGDWFGFSLAATDQDNNGIEDLMVGSTQEDVAGVANAGATLTILGQFALGLGGGSVFDLTANNGFQDWDPEKTTHTWNQPLPELGSKYVGENFGFAITS